MDRYKIRIGSPNPAGTVQVWLGDVLVARFRSVDAAEAYIEAHQ